MGGTGPRGVLTQTLGAFQEVGLKGLCGSLAAKPDVSLLRATLNTSHVENSTVTIVYSKFRSWNLQPCGLPA